jgi:hypothetical protein
MNKLLTTVFALLALSACSETVTKPDEHKPEMIPLTIGNYWIYSSYEIDGNYAAVAGTESTDSIVVQSELEYLGRKGFMLVTYSNGSATDTNYYSKVLGNYNQNFSKMHNILNDFAQQWLFTYNYEAAEWNVGGIHSTETAHYEDSTYQAPLVHAVNAVRKPLDSMEYEGTRHYTDETTIKFDRKLAFTHRGRKYLDSTTYDPDTTEYSKVSSCYLRTKLAEGIGPVSIQLDPETTTITKKYINYPQTDTKTEVSKINGRKRQLIRYGLKK